MKIKPILFKGPMVRAIQNGTKTQTRRIIKNIIEVHGFLYIYNKKSKEYENANLHSKFKIGDILWVRETWQVGYGGLNYIYKADCDNRLYSETKWKPSIFMPKAACRNFLKVTNVRIERLHDITQSDAISEGIEIVGTKDEYIFYKNYQDEKVFFQRPDYSFCTLWDSINTKVYRWKSNPWVFVYDFEKTIKPENFIL